MGMVFLIVTLAISALGRLHMLFPMLSMFYLHSLSDDLPLTLWSPLK